MGTKKGEIVGGVGVIFFFKQKAAYEMLRSRVGSEMSIRDKLEDNLDTEFDGDKIGYSKIWFGKKQHQ